MVFLKKWYLVVLVLVGIVSLFIGGKGWFPGNNTNEVSSIDKKIGTQEKCVTLSINGKSKKILSAYSVAYRSGDTVFDLLLKGTKQNNIQLEYKGSDRTPYVIGIGNVYEKDDGNQSGWTYKVNGEIPKEGSGTYLLQPNDKVEWIYLSNE